MENQNQEISGAEKHEFADIEVSPSQLADVHFVRKRGQGGRLVEYISAKAPDSRMVYFFDGVSKTQLVSRVGGKISELRRIYDYQKRDRVFTGLVTQRPEPVILRLVRSNGYWHCYAVVTARFTEVGHAELYKMVENEFVARGLAWTGIEEFRTNRRVWRTYLFEKNIGAQVGGVQVGDIIQCGLRIANSCKATSSIIFYPFWKRLVCSNGLTSSKGIWKPATTHVGLKVDILQSVKQTLDEALNQAFGFDKLMQQAREIRLQTSEMELLVREVSVKRGFAEYVQRSIRYRLDKEDKTLWGLVNAFTYVSSHDVKPDQSKLVIEQAAHFLLKGGEKLVREILTPSPAGLALQATCRECREKPVAEVGETCPECEIELNRVAMEEDAFDIRMGLNNEDADSDG